MTKINIVQYKWEGKWGPFKVKVRCGECDLSSTILKSMIKKEFKGKDVKLTILPWLDNWYKVILKGGWHAPIFIVNGRLFSQGNVISRSKLKEYTYGLLKK